jgi:hypothetical protein
MLNNSYFQQLLRELKKGETFASLRNIHSGDICYSDTSSFSRNRLPLCQLEFVDIIGQNVVCTQT